MVGREHHYIQAQMEDEKPKILESFIKQFYSGTPFLPKEIITQYPLEDEALITAWLSEKKGAKDIFEKQSTSEQIITPYSRWVTGEGERLKGVRMQ